MISVVDMSQRSIAQTAVGNAHSYVARLWPFAGTLQFVLPVKWLLFVAILTVA